MSILQSQVSSHLVTLRTCASDLLAYRRIDESKELDSLAITIWNISTRLDRDGDDPEGKNCYFQHDYALLLTCLARSDELQQHGKSSLLPLCRAFAFHLLDSIARSHSSGPSSIATRKPAAEQWKDNTRLLRTALKAAKSCLQSGYLEHAIKILERAASYLETQEKLAKKKKDKIYAEDEQKVKLSIGLRMEYLCLRVTLAWKEENLDLAQIFFDQANEITKENRDVSPEQQADLAFEIGRQLQKQEDYYRAAKWLERAHLVIGAADVTCMTPDAEELRLSIAHHLTRSYLESKTDTAQAKANEMLGWMEAVRSLLALLAST